MIKNVVLVSGIEQSDSVIHIHVSILFQILFPVRLLQNVEQSSLCYTVGPCWLSNTEAFSCGRDWLFCMTLPPCPTLPIPLLQGRGRTRTSGWKLWRSKIQLDIRKSSLVAACPKVEWVLCELVSC